MYTVEYHKRALKDIAKGEAVIKYGFSIGNASCDIKAGEQISGTITDLDFNQKYRNLPYIGVLKPEIYN